MTQRKSRVHYLVVSNFYLDGTSCIVSVRDAVTSLYHNLRISPAETETEEMLMVALQREFKLITKQRKGYELLNSLRNKIIQLNDG